MCEPVSISMAVAGAASAAMGARNQAKFEGQQIDAQRRQHHELVKQLNWGNADGQIANRDNYESARMALTETGIEHMNNMAMLSTALGEAGIGGRTAGRLQRVAGIQNDIEESNIAENYHRDYAAIFADAVGRTESTKGSILGAAPIQRTSKLTQAMNIGQGAMSGYSMGGGKFGFDKGGAAGSVRSTAGVKGTQSVPYKNTNPFALGGRF